MQLFFSLSSSSGVGKFEEAISCFLFARNARSRAITASSIPKIYDIRVELVGGGSSFLRKESDLHCK
jgi:hypothetical protein